MCRLSRGFIRSVELAGRSITPPEHRYIGPPHLMAAIGYCDAFRRRTSPRIHSAEPTPAGKPKQKPITNGATRDEKNQSSINNKIMPSAPIVASIEPQASILVVFTAAPLRLCVHRDKAKPMMEHRSCPKRQPIWSPAAIILHDIQASIRPLEWQAPDNGGAGHHVILGPSPARPYDRR